MEYKLANTLSFNYTETDVAAMRQLLDQVFNVNNPHYDSILVDGTRNTFSYKCGRWSGQIVSAPRRVTSFFKRKETKTVAAISYWAFETLTTILAILTTSSFTAVALLVVMWLFATYVFVGALGLMLGL